MARKWAQMSMKNKFFQKEVFGPLLLEIECDRGLEVQVENFLPLHIKYGFVVQTKDDHNYFREKCPQYKDTSVFCMADAANTLKRLPGFTDERLAEMQAATGMQLRRMRDVLRANDVVMATLVREAALLNAVATPDADIVVKQYGAAAGAGAGAGAGSSSSSSSSSSSGKRGPSLIDAGINLFGATHTLRLFKSWIDGDVFENSKPNLPAKYLHIVVDRDAVERRRAELAAARGEAAAALQAVKTAAQAKATLAAQVSAAQADLARLKELGRARASAEGKLQAARAALEEMHRSAKDAEAQNAQRKELLDKAVAAQSGRAALAAQLEAAARAFTAESLAAAAAYLDHLAQQCLFERAKSEHASVRKSVTQADKVFQLANERADAKVAEANHRERDYNKARDSMVAKSASYQDVFAALPTTLDEVRAKAKEVEAQLEGINVDERAKVEYEKHSQEEAAISKTLEQERKKLDERGQAFDGRVKRLGSDIASRTVALGLRFGAYMRQVRLVREGGAGSASASARTHRCSHSNFPSHTFPRSRASTPLPPTVLQPPFSRACLRSAATATFSCSRLATCRTSRAGA